MSRTWFRMVEVKTTMSLCCCRISVCVKIRFLNEINSTLVTSIDCTEPAEVTIEVLIEQLRISRIERLPAYGTEDWLPIVWVAFVPWPTVATKRELFDANSTGVGTDSRFYILVRALPLAGPN